MLKGIDENGNIKNVRVSDKGSLFVKLVGSSGTDTSDATAVASDIKKGKTAYARGEKITGTYEGGSGGDMNVKMFTDISELSDFDENLANNHLNQLLLNIPDLDTSNFTDLSNLFATCTRITTIPNIKVTNKCLNLYGLFSLCSSIEEFDLTNLGWDTSNVTQFGQMFYGCRNAKKINLQGIDFSGINFDDEEHEEGYYCVEGMFGYCTSLKEIDYGTLPQLNYISLVRFFEGCAFESIDLSVFDISKVVSLSQTFKENINLESITFGNLNTDNVIIRDMSEMIYNCPSLSKQTLHDILTICSKVDLESEFYMGSTCIKSVGFTDEQLALFTQEELQPVLDAGWTLDWE